MEHLRNLSTPPDEAGNASTTSTSSDDERLAQLASSQLAASGYPQLRSLRVFCNHGTITLQGRVPTLFLKQVAQDLMREISPSIDNDIQAKGFTNSDPSLRARR